MNDTEAHVHTDPNGVGPGRQVDADLETNLETLTVDCDTCVVRGNACGDCVVTVLLGSAPDGVRLDAEEVDALDALSSSGLVPPLRLVTPLNEKVPDSA